MTGVKEITPAHPRCRSCGAEIRFLRTRAGKAIPVDIDSVKPSDHEFDPDRHMTHFKTCPEAGKWRKRR